MPKEVVYNSEKFSSDEPEVTSMVELSWGRDADYVQLATTLNRSVDHSPIERKVSGGWYINLDRAGINKLIRDLRRARDQAYGRDE